ncbi:hypothetical protein [Endozoicomonas euniceicola]|uniref:Uncharacterized protein n=1 Tax=Endozoicomonas euniceicola TaxID=1234143 RepID=A0ABY6H016_9GAMM|nr:hypothetical protein [Endozoicomonas euniceicola]UYM17509.1 hypothetical protein NX720_06225 [Endozoicomonas euniceicola]
MDITKPALPALSVRNTATEEPVVTPEATLSGKPLTITEGSSTSGLKRSSETEAYPADQPVKRQSRFAYRDGIIDAFEDNGNRGMTYHEITKWIQTNRPDLTENVKDVTNRVSVVLSRYDDFKKTKGTKGTGLWHVVEIEHRAKTKERHIYNFLNNPPGRIMETGEICEQLKANGVKNAISLAAQVRRILSKNPQFEEAPAPEFITDTSQGKVKKTYWKLSEPENNQPSTSTTVPTTSHQSASGWMTPRGFSITAPVHHANSSFTIRVNGINYYLQKAGDIPDSLYQHPEANQLTSKMLEGYEVSDFVNLYNFANKSEDMQGIYLDNEFYYLIETGEFKDNH